MLGRLIRVDHLQFNLFLIFRLRFLNDFVRRIVFRNFLTGIEIHNRSVVLNFVRKFEDLLFIGKFENLFFLSYFRHFGLRLRVSECFGRVDFRCGLFWRGCSLFIAIFGNYPPYGGENFLHRWFLLCFLVAHRTTALIQKIGFRTLRIKD